MNTKKYMSILSALACVAIVGTVSCGSDEDSKDMTYPEISGQGITPNPVDCQQYKRGEVIPVDYILTDNATRSWGPTTSRFTAIPTIIRTAQARWNVRNMSMMTSTRRQ